MIEDELMNIRLPPIRIQVIVPGNSVAFQLQGTVYLSFDNDQNDLWYLKGELDTEPGQPQDRVLLES